MENSEFLEIVRSVELNTNPTENTQQNPLQIRQSSYSEIFAEQVKKSICRIATTILGSFVNQNKLKLKMILYDYEINEKLNL